MRHHSRQWRRRLHSSVIIIASISSSSSTWLHGWRQVTAISQWLSHATSACRCQLTRVTKHHDRLSTRHVGSMIPPAAFYHFHSFHCWTDCGLNILRCRKYIRYSYFSNTRNKLFAQCYWVFVLRHAIAWSWCCITSLCLHSNIIGLLLSYEHKSPHRQTTNKSSRLATSSSSS